MKTLEKMLHICHVVIAICLFITFVLASRSFYDFI